jgi:hypothetical protein
MESSRKSGSGCSVTIRLEDSSQRILWALDTARRGARYVELRMGAEVPSASSGQALRPAKDAGLRMTIKAG